MSPWPHGLSRALLAASLALVALPENSLAQTRAPDLADVSIEDLMNIEISSASRKGERAADVPGAIFVITHDDIRRSGMSTLPDLLRLAPGVDVAQINSNKWAVSVRGFNALYANKLLVLVDGRSVYNRIFSGVLWDGEDLMLDDIDRIEVIRGPGAAMWGANAVNGVINIITKTTADTQGGLARVEVGRAGNQGAVRYGGNARRASYRVYSQWTGRDQSLIAPGRASRRCLPQRHDRIPRRLDDAARHVRAGRRLHRRPGPRALAQPRPVHRRERSDRERSRPTRRAAICSAAGPTPRGGRGAAGAVVCRSRGPAGAGRRLSPDVRWMSTRSTTRLSARARIWSPAQATGSSTRSSTGRTGISLTPAQNDSSLFTAFIQDEIALFGSRLAVTLGGQVQYDSVSGAGVQPTARAIWKGLPRQRLWTAVSRALRTPSLNEQGIRLDYPPVATESGLPLMVTALGNPAALTETFADIEAGYRIEIGKTASMDVTGFTGRYEHLVTQEPGAPAIEFVPAPQIHVTSHGGNLLSARTRGLELAVNWAPVPAWRLDGSYTALHITPQLDAASHDPVADSTDGDAPQCAVAGPLGIRSGEPRDAGRCPVPRRPHRADTGGGVHARRHHRAMVVHPPAFGDGDRTEPVRRGARRVRRRRLAADGDAGATQRQRAPAVGIQIVRAPLPQTRPDRRPATGSRCRTTPRPAGSCRGSTPRDRCGPRCRATSTTDPTVVQLRAVGGLRYAVIVDPWRTSFTQVGARALAAASMLAADAPAAVRYWNTVPFAADTIMKA